MGIFECSARTLINSYYYGLCEFEDTPGCQYFQGSSEEELCRCYPDNCIYKILENEGGYLVVIDKQCSLLPAQIELLKDKSIFLIRVPVNEISLDDQVRLAKTLSQILSHYPLTTVVFASPISFLLRELMVEIMFQNSVDYIRVRLLYNNKQEEKTLPGGRMVYTVPAEGWRLV